MESPYGRQLLLTAGMILISFALLRTAFIGLSYQCTIRETRDSMERSADYVANFTAKVRAEGVDVRDMACQLYVASAAHIANTFVPVTEADGELVPCLNGAAIQNGLGGNYLPQSIVSQLQRKGGYSGITTLGGLFPEKRFVVGIPIMVKAVNLATGQIEQTMIGVAYVVAETSDIIEPWQVSISIFLFTAVVVPCVAFTTSSITSLRLINPLKEIAETACKFGHGEYEVRVQGYEKRKDEVGKLAEAFNVMADSTAESGTRRSEFVANISHELKTPMTTIVGFFDGILNGTIPSDRERAALQTISPETRRLSRLVRWMLDLSRPQSAKNVTAQEQFDVSEVMLRVPASLENKINVRHLDVDTRFLGGPVLAWGDPDATTQACYNLLDNVIKLSAEGSTVGLSITAKGGKAHVVVRNHGDTIPLDELATIFDRFHKSGKSCSVDRKGVGLGLYIVKTIPNNRKENISVTSRGGVTEFVFTLTPA